MEIVLKYGNINHFIIVITYTIICECVSFVVINTFIYSLSGFANV